MWKKALQYKHLKLIYKLYKTKLRAYLVSVAWKQIALILQFHSLHCGIKNDHWNYVYVCICRMPLACRSACTARTVISRMRIIVTSSTTLHHRLPTRRCRPASRSLPSPMVFTSPHPTTHRSDIADALINTLVLSLIYLYNRIVCKLHSKWKRKNEKSTQFTYFLGSLWYS